MVKNLYSIFRFSFEILCIGIAGYWGFSKTTLGNWRFVLGILAPLAIIIIWSIWAAPSSPNRLQGVARLALELGIYAVISICLYNTNYKSLVFYFILLSVANASVNYFTKWLL